jgi:hypothetical protein
VPPRGLGQDRPPQEVLDQALAVGGVERLQQQRGGVELAAPPSWAGVQQLRAGQAAQQDRGLAGPVGDVVDEVEQGRLGPVQVVQQHHQRPLAGQRLQQPAHRPRQLLGAVVQLGQAEQAGQPLDDQRGVLLAGEHRLQLGPGGVRPVGVGQARRRAQQLGDRPVGDALAVRQAAALEHGRPPVDLGEQLRRQPGLAHPGGPEHGDQVAGAVAGGGLERVPQQPQRAATPDHRRVEPACVAGDAGSDRQQPEGGDRLPLALEGERSDRLDGDRVADQAPGRLAQQHLTGGGGLLQPGGEVDRVAEHQGVADVGIAGHHLAGVDPGAHRQGHAPVALQLAVQPLDALAQLGRGADRPHGVVLVQRRDAEHGHHRVADELLHGAAVALQHRPHRREPARHHPAERLGVQPLAEAGRPGEVAEHHGHDLAGLAPAGRSRDRRAAAEAEPGSGRVLLAAHPTGDHAQECRRGPPTNRAGACLTACGIPAGCSSSPGGIARRGKSFGVVVAWPGRA